MIYVASLSLTSTQFFLEVARWCCIFVCSAFHVHPAIYIMLVLTRRAVRSLWYSSHYWCHYCYPCPAVITHHITRVHFVFDFFFISSFAHLIFLGRRCRRRRWYLQILTSFHTFTPVPSQSVAIFFFSLWHRWWQHSHSWVGSCSLRVVLTPLADTVGSGDIVFARCYSSSCCILRLCNTS